MAGLTMRNVSRVLSRCRLPLRAASVRCASGVVKSTFPDMDLPKENAFCTVFRGSEAWGHHVAAECATSGRSYTYSQLKDGALRWAGLLGCRLGLNKGDVVAMVMPNCPEYPMVMYGALAGGFVVTTVNPSYTQEEVHRQLEDSGAAVVVCDPAYLPTVEGAVTLSQRAIPTITLGPSASPGTPNLLELLQDKSLPFVDPVEVNPEDLALMPYSSGTTGPPKGVAISHFALASSIEMYIGPGTFATPFSTGSSQSSFMCVLPFYHIYGIAPIMSCGLRAGVKLVTVSKFDPHSYVGDIAKHKVSSLHLVPPLLNFLASAPIATPEALASVQHILVGAAPVSLTSAQAFTEKIQRPIFFQEGYGMTELILTHILPVGTNQLGTCGALLPNVQARIVDVETGENLGPLQNGEIWIKTPSVMNGYFKNPKATAETIDAEGWLHTGDIGNYDDQGLFRIVDRTKELIKVKGLQVSPSELEDILRKCPGVGDVGVVGVPHDRLGEAPRAYVVSSATTSEAQIHAFLEGKVAAHKRLVGGVSFVKELPKTATGKLLRRELKKMSLDDV